MARRKVVVLLAEDSLADQRLVQRAMARGQYEVVLKTVDNGKDVLNYLKREGVYADADSAPMPDLVLLDINMPRMDGKQVLRALRSDDGLQKLPVVMLTTSNQEQDISESYGLGANAYISKPAEIDEYYAAMEQIEDFWLGLALLPVAAH